MPIKLFYGTTKVNFISVGGILTKLEKGRKTNGVMNLYQANTYTVEVLEKISVMVIESSNL